MNAGGDEFLWVTAPLRYGVPLGPAQIHQEPLDLRPQGSESPLGDPHGAWVHHNGMQHHAQQQQQAQQQQTQHLRRDSYSETTALTHLHLPGCHTGQHHHHQLVSTTTRPSIHY